MNTSSLCRDTLHVKDSTELNLTFSELLGCENRALSICWPEVVKGVPYWGLVFMLAGAGFLGLFVMFWACVVFCFVIFSSQYQCNELPGMTRLQSDLLCVEWIFKPYTLTRIRGL